ncbi:MAG TPA: hypothetical protein VIO36_06735 [Anaerolineaceae bacterium]
MVSKSFLDRLNTHVNTSPSTIPLDVALLGVPLEEAACIDMDHAIAGVAASESISDALSFSDLSDARMPLPTNNLFAQFQTSSACIKSEFPGWLGVHVVPFSVARRSRMFSLLSRIPDRIDSWAEAYTLVIYREWPLEISLAPAGMLIGLDRSGSITDAAMFSIMLEHDIGARDKSWEHVSRLTAWIVYLTFCVFTMANQGEAALKYQSPRLWKI